MSNGKREVTESEIVKTGTDDHLIRGSIEFELRVEGVEDEHEAYRLAEAVCLSTSEWVKGHVHIHDENLDIYEIDEDEEGE